MYFMLNPEKKTLEDAFIFYDESNVLQNVSIATRSIEIVTVPQNVIRFCYSHYYSAKKVNIEDTQLFWNNTTIDWLINECNCKYSVSNGILLRDACILGLYPVAKHLIEDYHYNPHIINDESLQCAAKSDSLELVQYLVETCKCNPKSNKYKAIYEAVKYSEIPVIKYLIEKSGYKVHRNHNMIYDLAKDFNTEQVIKYVYSLCYGE